MMQRIFKREGPLPDAYLADYNKPESLDDYQLVYAYERLQVAITSQIEKIGMLNLKANSKNIFLKETLERAANERDSEQDLLAALYKRLLKFEGLMQKRKIGFARKAELRF
jgi:hypothetical protein